MESLKRKRRSSVAVGVVPQPAPPEEEAGDKLVTDNEVEEFFAILHRVRDARCLSEATQPPAGVIPGGGGGTTRWNPAFSWEDFAEAPDAVGRGAAEKKRSPSMLPPPPPPAIRPGEFIDLNADPSPLGRGGQPWR